MLAPEMLGALRSEPNPLRPSWIIRVGSGLSAFGALRR
jgi:hypothetical protein